MGLYYLPSVLWIINIIHVTWTFFLILQIYILGVHFLALLLVSGIVYDLSFNGKLESHGCSILFVKSFFLYYLFIYCFFVFLITVNRTRSELEHFDISDLRGITLYSH